ncbi:MAG: hypothetical protein KGJ13_02510 [Patescibacteria group bacterium]|nr:hypothetical protein [Patescibacteria group bacterium]
MQSLISLLQAVLALLLIVQGNSGIPASQQQQVISAATEVVSTVQQAIQTGAVATVNNTSNNTNNNSNTASTASYGNTNNASNPAQAWQNYSQTGQTPNVVNPAAYFGQLSNPEWHKNKYDYLGTQVGPGIITGGGACTLNTTLDSQGMDMALEQLLCQRASAGNKTTLASIDYQDPGGTCYHWDWTGKYQFDCSVLSSLLGHAPAVLSSVPTSALDPTLQNLNLNANCWWDVSVGIPPGLESYEIVCGVTSGR